MVDEDPTQPVVKRPRWRLLIEVLWKALILLVALIIGLMAANTVGWNGGAWLLGSSSDAGWLDSFADHSLMLVGIVVCAGVFYLVIRVAKWALWLFVPVMAYSAFVLGTWNGIASGFDVTRMAVIREHYANAYALQHMGRVAFDATCRDPSVSLTEDARALCAEGRPQ